MQAGIPTAREAMSLAIASQDQIILKMQNMTEPLIHFNKIYPFDKNQIGQLVIGEKYVGIMLKNGQTGVCSTLKNDVVFDIGNKPNIDLNDLNHRIVYNAYINAILNYHNSYKANKDIFDAIEFSQKNNIVMIGYFRPLVKKFAEEKIPINIFDLYEQDHNIQPVSQQKQALKEAGTVILTSTSIFNNTFKDIVQQTKHDCDIYLLGPSSILHPHMLTFRNIKNIFGAVFKKNDPRILEAIENGNGTQTFLPFGTKVCI